MKTLFVLILSSLAFCGLSQSPVILKHNNFANDSFIHLDSGPWRFTNNQEVKHPSLNISNWHVLPGTDFGMHDKPRGWTGNGWFALWIKVDEVLAGQKLAIHVNHDGASEIYIDGKPAGGYGKLGASADAMQAARPRKALIPFWPGDTLPHLITIHYANFTGPYADFLGFQLAIGVYDVAYKKLLFSNQCMNFMLTTIGAYFILGCLFFFLYIFYPGQKLNMHYALFVLLLGLTMQSIYFFYEANNPQIQFYAEVTTYICKILMMWSGSIMLYAIGYASIPRARLVVISVISAAYIIIDLVLFFFFKTYSWNDYFIFIFLLFIADGFISISKAKKRGQPNTGLIATGIAATTLVFFFAWGDVFGLWPRSQNSLRLLVIAAGNFIFPACFSFCLALDVARTNRRLANKLKEIEILYAKNLTQEAEKLALVSSEAKRLEGTVAARTAEIQQQADKLKEMDAVKSRFFTNITHELKTPLTLILNPAGEIAKASASPSIKTNASLIKSNAQRLLQLINQLLDVSKLENSVMEINVEPVELVQEIKEQLRLYQPLAVQKEISLSFISDCLELEVFIDRDKLRKIIHNILSNAVKFTNKGAVEVSLKALQNGTDNGFMLKVKDTGTGIAESKLPFIFDRFYQADLHDNRSHEGSGIGLALTKELVTLMDGVINAESKYGAYTAITVNLPCTITACTPAKSFFVIDFDNVTNTGKVLPPFNTPVKPGKHLILVIEDNDDLRNFLCTTLALNYNVISAANGDAGVCLAQEQIPDVVITDIMMPGADGYQVCDTLRRDEKTSHIPVIFLTAKVGTDSRVKGMEAGAVAYLGKPYNQRELNATINNLIAMRCLLQKKYGTLAALNESTTLPAIEMDFVTRVQRFIDDHLDDQQFGADQLAALMTLSRSQLHRKLKGLLGKSAGELIRTTRMEHAHQLLAGKSSSVAEVAYMVGFSTPSAFAYSFSQRFGYPPSNVKPGANKR